MARTTYGGRYEVLERVGSGGMAEVYRARDELLGREVAVKVLSERFSRDRSFVERFRREAQSAANLTHPNIVSLYDYGSEDDHAYFIVMEYIDGRSLADIVAHEGPLLPERAAEIAADVAQALGRAHGAGIVHRDVKPANIMVTSSGQTKVTDFGIARAMGGDREQTMTQTGMVIGTAAYLSPEQAQGNPVDARSDVYSLGVVLYEMLAGRAPFSGDTPLSVAYKHVREMPPPPSSINPDVPRELDAIVMKALAKNPDNRYASASEMYEDLQRFLAGQKVLATPLLTQAATAVTPGATRTEVLQETRADEEELPERSRAGWYALSALAILALFAVLAWLLFSNLIGNDADFVTVPNVVGLQVDDARDLLEDDGLEVRTVTKPSNRRAGVVIRQEPEEGEEIPVGEQVLLTVSSGPEQVEVPDFVGLTVDEARAEAEALNLRLRVTTEPNDDVPEGEIFEQSPDAGEEVNEGSAVRVVASGGAATVVVPDVIGQTEEDAIAELQAAGFTVDTTTQPSDEDEGIVIAQDPGGGEEAEPGDTVVITVSEGPEERDMPNVEGEDADDAEALLENEYGLDVTIVEEACAAAVPPGVVCDQDPEPGTPVAAGDEATLYVQPGDASLPRAAVAFLLLLFF